MNLISKFFSPIEYRSGCPLNNNNNINKTNYNYDKYSSFGIEIILHYIDASLNCTELVYTGTSLSQSYNA